MSPLFDRAAASRKAILPDLRGTGRSRLARLDSTTITLDRAVADLEAIRRHQDVERWTLVGHSWGGVLAMAYAAAHPERVSGLVLIGTGSASLAAMSAASGRLRERLTQADIDSIRFWASRARDSRDSAQAQIEMKRIGWNAYIYDRVKLPAVSAWLSPETYSATVSELMWRDLRSPPYDLRRELLVLREDSVPVYLIGGVADEIALAAHAELEVLFPWAAVRMVPRSGHFPWVEASEHFFRYFDEAISVTRE